MLSYHYTPLLDSQAVKGIDITSRPWDLNDRIKSYAQPDSIMLDIGCGSAKKLLAFTNDFLKIIGLEPNDLMYTQAQKNIKSISNIFLIAGYAQQLPFKSESFDLVTEMLAPHDNAEVFRVLKPKGHAILEKTGEEDKKWLIDFFGQDRFYFKDCADRTKNFYIQDAKNIFSKVQFEEGSWKTVYTYDELIVLLEQAPIVKNFNKINDADILARIKKDYCKNGKVILTQQRYLLTVEK